MRHRKTVAVLTILIILLSGIAAVTGIFSNKTALNADITTVYGDVVELHNKGLYARDSVSMAAQAAAQDIVTLIVGIPFLSIALLMVKKGSIKGALLLTGTLSYFLYTYTSYAFIMMYNSFFLIYVALMALSFYAFVLCIMSFQGVDLKQSFSEKFPAKSLCVFFLLIGVMLCLLWLGRIIPALFSKIPPYGLEQYSTLGIQALDLGFIVPACVVTARLIWKKRRWGYLLAVVLIIKSITMSAAVSAMVVSMLANGIDVSVVERIVFPALTLFSVFFMFKILTAIINEHRY